MVVMFASHFSLGCKAFTHLAKYYLELSYKTIRLYTSNKPKNSIIILKKVLKVYGNSGSNIDEEKVY